MPLNYLLKKTKQKTNPKTPNYFQAGDLLDKWTKVESEYFGHTVAYD